MSFLTIAANLATNALTRQQHGGREYAIAPAVLAKAGVLNNMLLPATELAAFAEAWNGRPVPLRHPTDSAGNYISANSPAVLARQGLGQIFNARMEGDRLLGDLWLDVAQIQQLGGQALAALQRMERGELVDVSTAYFHDTEAGSGDHNGRAYNGIQRNIRPDHVALLPDEQGACSVADGCGTPRVNSQCTCQACAAEASVSSEPSSNTGANQMTTNQQEVEVVAEAVTEGEKTTPAIDTAAIAEVAANAATAALTKLFAPLGGIEAFVQTATALAANAQRERATRIARLAANAAVPFTAEQLTAMTDDVIAGIEAMAAPQAADYGALFAPGLATNRADEEWTAYEEPKAA